MQGDDETIYRVIASHAEEYSLWPADRENPLGWADAGKSGTKADCIAWLEQLRNDMRPPGLRQRMQEPSRGDGG